MKLSLMMAMSENGIIGNGLDIPWKVKGEQLLFKAMTFNQWLIVGRKTFESMGELPNRKYAIISSQEGLKDTDTVKHFNSIEKALAYLSTVTDHAYVAGGGTIYKQLMDKVSTIHVSVIHEQIAGDIAAPVIDYKKFGCVFTQRFGSNIDYTYKIYQRL